MQVLKQIPLADYSTMKIGGLAKYFTTVKSKDELVEALTWARDKDTRVFVLGEGSNVVFGERGFAGLVIKNEIKGFKILEDTDEHTTIQIGAGEPWDSVVERTVKRGLSGIEALSKIPGTTGATPVQNVGAYGQEISDSLVELTAYDRQRQRFVTLSRADCGFGYRTSIFKGEARGRYIITSITLRLSKDKPQPPFYKSLQAHLDKHDIRDYSPRSIREAVMAVRAQRLPDPEKVPSNGSFFKNPIVSETKLAKLKQEFPDIVAFTHAQGQVKLAAGWLVEHIEPPQDDHLKLFAGNALCITNTDGADFKSLIKFKDEIKARVKDKFGVELEEEPEIIS